MTPRLRKKYTMAAIIVAFGLVGSLLTIAGILALS